MTCDRTLILHHHLGQRLPPPPPPSLLPSGWVCPSVPSYPQIAIYPGWRLHQGRWNYHSNQIKRIESQCQWILSCPSHARASISRTTLPGGCTSMWTGLSSKGKVANHGFLTAVTSKLRTVWSEISPKSITLYTTGKLNIAPSSKPDLTPTYRKLLRTVDGGTLCVVSLVPLAARAHPSFHQRSRFHTSP